MFKILFHKNKFKLGNDFDSEHCEEFLKEKKIYLRTINLDNSLYDDDKKNEVWKKHQLNSHSVIIKYLLDTISINIYYKLSRVL